MSESDIIQATRGLPATVDSLAAELTGLGVSPGMHLLVHSSLRSMGWVIGGAAAVVLALEHALTTRGTLLMPTHSGDLSDPAEWRNPPVPESWWDLIRHTMPPFDPQLTPSRGVGAIAECFRKQKGVLRSDHPQVSFAAWGALARELTTEHPLNFGLGEGSPVARLYERGGHVLLLGVGHGNNTSLHLAEHRCPVTSRHVRLCHAPLRSGNGREWKAFRDVDLDDSDFSVIGERFAAETRLERSARIGQAEARLMPQRALVDFAVKMLPELRS